MPAELAVTTPDELGAEEGVDPDGAEDDDVCADPGGMITAVLAKTGRTAWKGFVGCGTTRIDPWGKEDWMTVGLALPSPAAWVVTTLIWPAGDEDVRDPLTEPPPAAWLLTGKLWIAFSFWKTGTSRDLR
jgi:hypothetical protein